MSSAEVRRESQSEVSRLDGRIDGLDESLRAVSDTLLDVKKVVDRHTVTLAKQGRTLDEHTRTLDEHTRILDEHTRILGQHGETLDGHTQLLHEILRRLPEPAGG
jgi:vacuolar-type H+-ATPase subunit I/STV1